MNGKVSVMYVYSYIRHWLMWEQVILNLADLSVPSLSMSCVCWGQNLEKRWCCKREGDPGNDLHSGWTEDTKGNAVPERRHTQ